MPTLKYQVWKGNYRTGMENPPDSETQHTFCNSIYNYYHSWILFPYNLYTCTKRSCGNRRVFKTVTGSSGEAQVPAEGGGNAETQAMKF